jgi:hypothetical protein
VLLSPAFVFPKFYLLCLESEDVMRDQRDTLTSVTQKI